MAVSTEQFAVGYVGNGVNDTFGFTFPIIAKSDIAVLVNGAEIGGNFVVVMNDVDDFEAGGNVVFDENFEPANGASVIVVRRRPRLQSVEFSSQAAVSGPSAESALDSIVMNLQQIAGRAVLFSERAVGEDFSGVIAGGLSGKAGYAIVVNDTEDGLALSLGPDGAPGQDGNTILTGAGAPGSGVGIDGDFYIN